MKKDNSKNKEEEKKTEGTRYLKRPKLEETNIPNPIQGKVKDPHKLYHFMKDVHDSTVPKMWAIFLNEGYFSIGNEPLALGEHALPENLDIRGLAHFASFFYSAHVVLLTNHITGDATPTEGDHKLMREVESALKTLKINLVDYVVVAGEHFWSMKVQEGKACHCGQQDYIPEE